MPASGEQLSKDLTLTEFRQFRDYIHDHSGIFLEESKVDSLRISLVTRATRLECERWEEYFDILAADETEFRELMNLVTINETSFFRFPAQFEILRSQVLPEIAARAGDSKRVMRLWSAGCSTGEEPYSLAMTFADSGLAQMGWRGEVVGTDVSTKALNHARQGTYAEKTLLNIGSDVVSRHFVPEGNGAYRLTPGIRGMCDFHYHNLIKEPYPLALMGNWDIIFCRNVTIYFKMESTKRVVSNFFRSLNEGGYLFVGHSETLSSISSDFELVELGGVFIYRKPVRVPRSFALGRQVGADARPKAHAGRKTAPAEPPSPPKPRALKPPVVQRAAAPVSQAAAPASSAEETPEALLAAAWKLTGEGRADEALVAVARALAANPNHAESHLLSAHLHADQGDYELALVECTKALTVNPLLPGARYILGVIYQRQGDVVRAVSELKKTVYIDPDFALAHLNLGNVYKSQGKYDAACREYENALRALYKNPDGGWTRYLGGWQSDVILNTCERSLLECRKAMGVA